MNMMIGLVPLGVILAGLFVSAASLKLGARLAGSGASWGRAFLAVVVIYPTGLFVTFFGSLLLTPPVGLLIGWFVILAILKVIFSASWTQALIIWALGTLAQILLFLAAAVLTGLGIQELMKHMDKFVVGREMQIGLGRFLPGLE
jgi:hypothetical protein